MADDEMQNGVKTWRKWKPKNWLSDADLRLCTLAAKGLWIEMLNLMMIGPMDGHLVGPNKKPMPVADLAKIVMAPVDEIEKLLKELKERRVYSVDRMGRIYSRRMVADAKLEESGRNSANKRWGNNTDNQGSSAEPTGIPNGKPNARERERERKKERRAKAQGELLANPSRAERKSRPWTVEEKRAYGHRAVAKALGANGWVIVAGAAEGNTDARRICKAKAKEIGATWYDGAMEINAKEA